MAKNKRKREELEKDNELLKKALETNELNNDLQQEAKKVKENIEESKPYQKEAAENRKMEHHDAALAVHAAKAVGSKGGPEKSALDKVQETVAKGVIASEGGAVESAKGLVNAARGAGKGSDLRGEEQELHQQRQGVGFAAKLHEVASPIPLPLSKEPQHAQPAAEKAAPHPQPDAPKPEESSGHKL